MTIDDDIAIVRQAIAGHPSAQGELARRAYPRVLACCMARVRQRADAEELAQETLLRAITGLSSLADPERWMSWMRGIAVHVCLDWLRRHSNRQAELVSEFADEVHLGTRQPDQIVAELRRKTASVPGVRVLIQNPPPINIGGQTTSALYQYTLQGIDLQEVFSWSEKVMAKFRQLPGLIDLSTNLNNRSLQLSVQVDREKLSPLGLNMAQVQDALMSAFGSRQVSTIYGTANQYYVILEVAPEFLSDPNALSRLYVRANTGKLVPLDAVARFERKAQVLTVNHLGQLPSVTISFNLAPGVALGTAVDSIRAAEKEIGMPVSVTGSLQGTAQAFQASLKGLGLLLLLAVIVIYIVLGVLYENFIHPLTILSGLPAAGVGALLTLLIFAGEAVRDAFDPRKTFR